LYKDVVAVAAEKKHCDIIYYISLNGLLSNNYYSYYIIYIILVVYLIASFYIINILFTIITLRLDLHFKTIKIILWFNFNWLLLLNYSLFCYTFIYIN